MIRLLVYVVFFASVCLRLEAQCNLSGLSPAYCLNTPASTLVANPPGGILSGAGLSGAVFNPSLAGVGTHTLSYVNCSSSYSLEGDAFASVGYTPNYIWFGDNDVSPALPIGFKFRFFCQTFDSIYLSSNGFFTFTPPQSSGCCHGLSLPDVNAPLNLIAFAWTDLDPSQGGTVRYCTVGAAPNRILVVSFNCVFHKTGNGPVTSEVYLYESSNLIEISTVTKPIPAGTVQYNTTMGIQGPAGQAYVVGGLNGTANWAATNELYRFKPGPYCETTVTTVVTAPPSVTAAISKTLICKGEPANLTGTGALSYSWSSGQSGALVTDYPSTPTVYTLTGWDQYNCVSTASVYVNVGSCESIHEETSRNSKKVVIYPNPSRGHVFLIANEVMELEIIDFTGALKKIISLDEENNFQITIRDLTPGIYLIADNRDNVIQKLIVSGN